MKNILLITVDEMRGDCAGYAGHPDAQTPSLDALAGRGSVLNRHFAPFPKCVPARCAMLTGRYTHTDGLRSVMEENHLPATAPTLPAFLRGQGYQTAVLGLNHVWDRDSFYGAGEKTNEPGAGVVDFTSFTNGPLAESAKWERVHPEGRPREGAAVSALAQLGPHGLSQGASSSFSDENRADQARLFLRELRDPARPFYLQVNFSAPHPPYVAPDPWYSRFQPEHVHPFPLDLPRHAPLPLRAQREWRTGMEFSEAAAREVFAVYLAMIARVDALVGEVLAELDRLGLGDDTLVIVTSDHGDYAGQYGLVEKWDSSLQDCLLRVPCVLAGPGIPAGRQFDGLTEHVDLPATIMEYLGFRPPPQWIWHGRSLLPLLAGGPGKEAVFADGGHEAPMRARFNAQPWAEKNGVRFKAVEGKQLTYANCPDAMARAKMVRTDTWKLVVRETGGNELYNVDEDPHEMNNLFGDPRYADITSDLQMKLLQWCLRTDPDLPFHPNVGA